MSTPIPTLSFACGVYDRVVPIFTGQVDVPGFHLDTKPIDDPRVIFDRQRGSEPEFDISEMSSSELIVRLSVGDRTFKAIPVMPSRVFRHGYIVVNTTRIRSPADLEGKRIGVQLYTMTAAIWIRGILRREYGVDLSRVEWIEGELDKPGTHGKPRSPEQTALLPKSLRQNSTNKSLDQLLVKGEIDAIIGADLPPSLGKVQGIERLFPDYVAEEKAYYRRTGVFPVMHLLVIRRTTAERYPDLPEKLYQALEKAKDMALARMRETNPLRYMLPWLATHVQEMEEACGPDPWRYGLERNRETLSQLLQFMYDDGFIQRLMTPDEIFQ